MLSYQTQNKHFNALMARVSKDTSLQIKNKICLFYKFEYKDDKKSFIGKTKQYKKKL